MSKFDRYMLSQLLIMFGFFSLVLVAVIWINKAVRLFDKLISDGQSAMVFLEFTTLGLPGLILLTVPLASFAAAVYVTNRLISESELPVMMATGSSPWRLARPVLFFGLVTAAMMSVLAHFLVPAALDILERREVEVNRDVTAGILTEGEFLHPRPRVTLYTRKITDDGVLHDVFLSDRRDSEMHVTYTSDNAYLVQRDGVTSLIMVDGMAQRLQSADKRLTAALFQDFSYDISNLTPSHTTPFRQISTLQTLEFLDDWNAIAARNGQPLGYVTEEFHSRFSVTLFSVSAALIGFAVLLSSGYSRFGVWREIILAFGGLVLLDTLRASISDPVRNNPELWPLIYLPPAIGLGAVFVLLAHKSGLFHRTRPELVS